MESQRIYYNLTNKTYLDVQEIFGEHGRAVVDGDARAIELATEHLGTDGHPEHVTGELAVRVSVVDFRCAFKDLSKHMVR